MISEEKKEKNMKLNKYQMTQMLKDRINGRILISGQKQDLAAYDEWKRWLVRMENKSLKERVNQEFIEDFIQWLQGRSTYNSTEFEKVEYDENGRPKDRKVVPGTPWGNKPLTFIPGVCEFLDQGIDRRDAVIKYITKLKMRGPRNVDECWMYFKYIIRGVGLDENGIHEVEFYSKFDYPEGPDGTPSGPDHPAPPLHNAAAYSANFRSIFEVAKVDPPAFVGWILNGAPPQVAIQNGVIPLLVEDYLLKHPGSTKEEAAAATADWFRDNLVPGTTLFYGDETTVTPFYGQTFDPTNFQTMNYRSLSAEDQDLMVAVAYANYVGQLIPNGTGTSPQGIPIVNAQGLPAKMTAFGGKKTADQEKEEKKKAQELLQKGVKVKKEQGLGSTFLSYLPGGDFAKKIASAVKNAVNSGAHVKTIAALEAAKAQADRTQLKEKPQNIKVQPPPGLNNANKLEETAKDMKELGQALKTGNVKVFKNPGVPVVSPSFGSESDSSDDSFHTGSYNPASSEHWETSSDTIKSEASSSHEQKQDLSSGESTGSLTSSKSPGTSSFESSDTREESKKSGDASMSDLDLGAASSLDEDPPMQEALKQADQLFAQVPGAIESQMLQEIKEAIKGVPSPLAQMIIEEASSPRGLAELYAFTAAGEIRANRNNIVHYAFSIPGQELLFDGMLSSKETAAYSDTSKQWIPINTEDSAHWDGIRNLAALPFEQTGGLAELARKDHLLPRKLSQEQIREFDAILSGSRGEDAARDIRYRLGAQARMAQKMSWQITNALNFGLHFLDMTPEESQQMNIMMHNEQALKEHPTLRAFRGQPATRIIAGLAEENIPEDMSLQWFRDNPDAEPREIVRHLGESFYPAQAELQKIRDNANPRAADWGELLVQSLRSVTSIKGVAATQLLEHKDILKEDYGITKRTAESDAYVKNLVMRSSNPLVLDKPDMEPTIDMKQFAKMLFAEQQATPKKEEEKQKTPKIPSEEEEDEGQKTPKIPSEEDDTTEITEEDEDEEDEEEDTVEVTEEDEDGDEQKTPKMPSEEEEEEEQRAPSPPPDKMEEEGDGQKTPEVSSESNEEMEDQAIKDELIRQQQEEAYRHKVEDALSNYSELLEMDPKKATYAEALYHAANALRVFNDKPKADMLLYTHDVRELIAARYPLTEAFLKDEPRKELISRLKHESDVAKEATKRAAELAQKEAEAKARQQEAEMRAKELAEQQRLNALRAEEAKKQDKAKFDAIKKELEVLNDTTQGQQKSPEHRKWIMNFAEAIEAEAMDVEKIKAASVAGMPEDAAKVAESLVPGAQAAYEKHVGPSIEQIIKNEVKGDKTLKSLLTLGEKAKKKYVMVLEAIQKNDTVALAALKDEVTKLQTQADIAKTDLRSWTEQQIAIVELQKRIFTAAKESINQSIGAGFSAPMITMEAIAAGVADYAATHKVTDTSFYKTTMREVEARLTPFYNLQKAGRPGIAIPAAVRSATRQQLAAQASAPKPNPQPQAQAPALKGTAANPIKVNAPPAQPARGTAANPIPVNVQVKPAVPPPALVKTAHHEMRDAGYLPAEERTYNKTMEYIDVLLYDRLKQDYAHIALKSERQKRIDEAFAKHRDTNRKKYIHAADFKLSQKNILPVNTQKAKFHIERMKVLKEAKKAFWTEQRERVYNKAYSAIPRTPDYIRRELGNRPSQAEVERIKKILPLKFHRATEELEDELSTEPRLQHRRPEKPGSRAKALKNLRARGAALPAELSPMTLDGGRALPLRPHPEIKGDGLSIPIRPLGKEPKNVDHVAYTLGAYMNPDTGEFENNPGTLVIPRPIPKVRGFAPDFQPGALRDAEGEPPEPEFIRYNSHPDAPPLTKEQKKYLASRSLKPEDDYRNKPEEPPPSKPIEMTEAPKGMMSRLRSVVVDPVTALSSKAAAMMSRAMGVADPQAAQQGASQEVPGLALPGDLYTDFSRQNKTSRAAEFPKPEPPEGTRGGLEYGSMGNIDRVEKAMKNKEVRKQFPLPLQEYAPENYQTGATELTQRLALLDYIANFKAGLVRSSDINTFLGPYTQFAGVNNWKDVSIPALSEKNVIPFLYSRISQQPLDPVAHPPPATKWDKKYSEMLLSLSVFSESLPDILEEARGMLGYDHPIYKELQQGTLGSLTNAKEHAIRALQSLDWDKSTNVTRQASNFINAVREDKALRAIASKTEKDSNIHTVFGPGYAKKLAENYRSVPGHFRKSSSIHPGFMFHTNTALADEVFGFTGRKSQPTVEQSRSYNQQYDNYAGLMYLEAWSQAALAATDSDSYTELGRRNNTAPGAVNGRLQAHYDAFMNAHAARKNYAKREYIDISEEAREELEKESTMKVKGMATKIYRALKQEDAINWKQAVNYKTPLHGQDMNTGTNIATDLAGVGRILKRYEKTISADVVKAVDRMFKDKSQPHSIYPPPLAKPDDPSAAYPDPKNTASYMPEFIKLLDAILDAKDQESRSGIGRVVDQNLRLLSETLPGPGTAQAKVLSGAQHDLVNEPMSARVGNMRAAKFKSATPSKIQLKKKAKGVVF